MRRLHPALRICCALACAILTYSILSLSALRAASAADTPTPLRVEAHSDTMTAVGVAQGERLSIHISRTLDNAPVRDAEVTVLLRGVSHPTVTEPDGSYSMQSKDLTLPGAASVLFQVTQGQSHQDLKGTLVVGGGEAAPEDKNGARQLGWWVLNFAVCIGFLMLWSRRRKAASGE